VDLRLKDKQRLKRFFETIQGKQARTNNNTPVQAGAQALCSNASIRLPKTLVKIQSSNNKKDLGVEDRRRANLGKMTLPYFGNTDSSYDYLQHFFLDKAHIKVTLFPPLNRVQTEKLKRKVLGLGHEFYWKYPKNYSKKNGLVFVAKWCDRNKAYRIVVVIMFNGLRYLRRKWEGENSKPKDVIDNSWDNAFCNKNYYMDGKAGIKEALSKLVSLVSESQSILSAFIGKLLPSFKYKITTVRVKEIEFNFHTLTQDAHEDFKYVADTIATHIGSISLDKTGKNLKGGIHATLRTGEGFKCYLKHKDVLRFEKMYNSTFFDKNYYKIPENKERPLLEILNELSLHSLKDIGFVIRAGPDEEARFGLGFYECIYLIAEHSKSQFKVLMEKLRHGNGHIYIASNEPLYTSGILKRLKNNQILVRDRNGMNGHYELHESLKDALLKGFRAVDVFL